MSVLAAVEADLKVLENGLEGVSGSAEAALALALAARLDDPGTPASAVGQIAARLLDALGVLRERVPETELSPLDRILERRAKRGARGSNAKGGVATTGG